MRLPWASSPPADHEASSGSTRAVGESGSTAPRPLARCAAGLRVLITGRARSRGEALAAKLGISFVPSDLAAGPDALRAFAAAATHALDGRVDVLVHNAALCPPVDTPSLSDADLEATLAVNVRSCDHLGALNRCRNG